MLVILRTRRRAEVFLSRGSSVARPFAGLLVIVAAFLAACSNSSPPQLNAPVPAPCLNCSQADNPFTPLATATTEPLPSVSGFSGTIFVPAAVAAGTITVSVSSANPGVTMLPGGKSLLYITLTAGAKLVSFESPPGFSIALPASAGAGPYDLALLENSGGTGVWTTIAGPSAAASSQVALIPASSFFSIAPNASAYFVVYTGGVLPVASSSSPNPQPTVSPMPNPSLSPAPTLSGSLPSPLPSSSLPAQPSASPSPVPSATPVAPSTPTASPIPAFVPAKLTISGLPKGTSGQSIGFASGVFNVGVVNAAGTQISGAYADAVTVASSDTTGVVELSLNGAPATQSVQLTSGSDNVGLVYSGATIGPITITASAMTAAASANGTFAPSIAALTYGGPTNSSGAPEIDLYAPSGQGTGSTASFTLSQPGFGSSFTMTSAATCAPFASIAASGNMSGTQTFTVTATASPSAGSCVVKFQGFGTSSPVSVTLTYGSFGVIFQ